MKKNCKYLVVLVVFLIWGGLYYRINNIYKPAIHDKYSIGQKCKYFGLEIQLKNIEVFTGREIEEKNDIDIYRVKTDKQFVVAATFHVRNISDCYVDIKEGLYTWSIEAAYEHNGANLWLVDELNDDVNPYEIGADVDYKLYFQIGYSGTKEELEKEQMRIYFGFYPELRYFEYNGAT